MLVTDVIAAFEAAWNANADAERLRLLASACVPEAVFVSPPGTTVGIGALNTSIAEFRHAFPAAVVSFGRPDEHGGYARVAWATRWNSGQPDLVGEDFAELADDMRIRLLVSFDGAPSATS